MKFPRHTWQQAKAMHRPERGDAGWSGLSVQGEGHEQARHRSAAYVRKVRSLKYSWQEILEEAEAEMVDHP